MGATVRRLGRWGVQTGGENEREEDGGGGKKKEEKGGGGALSVRLVLNWFCFVFLMSF